MSNPVRDLLLFYYFPIPGEPIILFNDKIISFLRDLIIPLLDSGACMGLSLWMMIRAPEKQFDHFFYHNIIPPGFLPHCTSSKYITFVLIADS